MRGSASVRIGCCLVVLLAGLAGVVAPAAAGPGTVASAGPEAIDPIPHEPQAESGGFDRSVFEITVHRDGRGVWTLRYERVLESTDERDSFEKFAARFREEETDLYRGFRTDADALVAAGENATGREMTAGGFARDAFVRSTIGNDIGVVELQFTWRGFGVVGEETITVGDVFEGGFYVGPDQELVFKPGESLAFRSVEPPGTRSNPDSLADSASVTWEGERQFTDRRPWAVFEPANATDATDANGTNASGGTGSATDTEQFGTGSGTATPTGPTNGPGETDAGEAGPLPFVVLGAMVLLAGVVAWRRLGAGKLDAGKTEPSSDRGDKETAAGEMHGDTGGTGGRATDAAEGDGTAAAGGAAAAGGTAAGSGSADDSSVVSSADRGDTPADHREELAATGETGAAAPAPSIPDEELLSDEDRVVRILREHGGRVKQSRIVDRTDWSKSKVSVLLSEMTDEGTVSKLRVGRENVVSLEGHEPDIAGSPFDDEATAGAETAADSNGGTATGDDASDEESDEE